MVRFVLKTGAENYIDFVYDFLYDSLSRDPGSDHSVCCPLWLSLALGFLIFPLVGNV